VADGYKHANDESISEKVQRLENELVILRKMVLKMRRCKCGRKEEG
jgi:hypothetical protein